MITPNNPTLPPNDPAVLGNMLVALVELLSRPEEAKKRIAEYSKAYATATEQIQRAQAATVELRQEQAKTLASLDEAKALHTARVNAEREAHDEHCRHRASELDEREKRVAALEAQAEADAAAAARLKADLQRRIRIVSEPMAAA